MDLCDARDRNQGGWVGMTWWEQAVIEQAGERKTLESAAETDGDGLEK